MRQAFIEATDLDRVITLPENCVFPHGSRFERFVRLEARQENGLTRRQRIQFNQKSDDASMSEGRSASSDSD